MSDVRVFDVWLMWVEFPDHPGVGKTRPVVVCEVSDDDVRGIVLKVTGNVTWDQSGDVPLLDWREAGLLKPSLVRCSQRFEFRREDLYRRFGRLSQRDALNVAIGLESLEDESSDDGGTHVRADGRAPEERTSLPSPDLGQDRE